MDPGFGCRVPVRKLTTYSALPAEDGRSYQSVRVRPISRVKRFELGRHLRQKVSRRSLGAWQPADNRSDPIALIQRLHIGREASLIPIRVARMVASPYGFLRGAAVVMAQDLASLPATGIPRSSAGTHTSETSAFTPRQNASWSWTSTTSTRHIPVHGNGTCGGWSPASMSPDDRMARRTRSVMRP